eukprot:Hpha_TRINITY_DN2201_c0_g1::TRINITY_DN2201_c0_g1_i1::g.25481::m.25481
MVSLDCKCFQYHKTEEGRTLVALLYPPTQRCERVLVFVPGLTDGLLGFGWLPMMAEAVGEKGWGLVQPVLSSSWLGYGVSSVGRDAKELDALLEHMKANFGLRKAVILGHSTGAQDAIMAGRIK